VRVPGNFFFSLLLLRYCVLHVLRHFVYWDWCIKAMCSTVACCNSNVLCKSVCADRSGMAVSRFLAAAGACVILLCFAESRDLHCNGCVKVANGASAADFFHLLRMVLLNLLLKSASKSSFFRLGVAIRFWSCNLCSRCAKFHCVLEFSLCRSLMLACFNGMFAPNLHRCDLAVRYSAGRVQLFCSRPCWHV